MRPGRRLTGLRTAVLAGALALTPARPAAAGDVAFVGGTVLTPAGPRPGGLVVRDGRIALIGSDRLVRAHLRANTRVVELAGGLVLPGFVDAHVHPGTVPDPAVTLDLAGLSTRAAVSGAITAFAASHPDRPWIDGTGWDKLAFPPDGRPTRAELDALVPDRPVLLYDNSGHEAWANSRALAAAGIDASTPDPVNGRIDRDAGGSPTGLLHEDTAMNLVAAHVPPLSASEQRAALAAALRVMLANGVTALEDAMATPEIAAAYLDLARSGALLQRVNLCLPFDPLKDDAAQVASFVRARRTLRTGRLTADCVKLFIDGAASHTVALIDPYSDDPRYGRGELFIDPKRLDRLVVRLDALGFRVHMHAQGDAAVRAGLDAFAAARRANGDHDRRHTIAHLWLVDPADVPRFRELHVIANMSPLWSLGDTWETVDAPRMFGTARNRHTFPTRSLLDAGATLVFGTDWPVTGVSPADGLETAVTHRYPGGKDPLGQTDRPWHPWERISLDEAVAAYTRTGAYFLHEERHLGTLANGRPADLVVLDRSLYRQPAGRIHAARVRLTMIGGHIVYEQAGAP